jgi:hypothetical protein
VLGVYDLIQVCEITKKRQALTNAMVGGERVVVQYPAKLEALAVEEAIQPRKPLSVSIRSSGSNSMWAVGLSLRQRYRTCIKQPVWS